MAGFVVGCIAMFLFAFCGMWTAMTLLMPDQARILLNAYIGWRRLRQRSPHDH